MKEVGIKRELKREEQEGNQKGEGMGMGRKWEGAEDGRGR